MRLGYISVADFPERHIEISHGITKSNPEQSRLFASVTVKFYELANVALMSSFDSSKCGIGSLAA